MTIRSTTDSEHLSDLGNARRMVNEFGNVLRFVPAWGRWLVWLDTHWQRDDLGYVMQYAKKTAIQIFHEAADNIDGDSRKELGRHALQSESRRALEAMVALAQTELGIPLNPDALDSDPWLWVEASTTTAH